jgi:hypothetical protein
MMKPFKKEGKLIPKRAPINLNLKKSCSLCLYAVMTPFDGDYFNCHRYPKSMRAAGNHWCGEYILKDK